MKKESEFLILLATVFSVCKIIKIYPFDGIDWIWILSPLWICFALFFLLGVLVVILFLLSLLVASLINNALRLWGWITE